MVSLFFLSFIPVQNSGFFQGVRPRNMTVLTANHPVRPNRTIANDLPLEEFEVCASTKGARQQRVQVDEVFASQAKLSESPFTVKARC
jgi:hypothetical protein